MAPGWRRGAEASGLALRALDVLHRFPGRALFDRLLRGRAWIGLLTFSLIGIVAMQLLVLELNTGIGHTLQREALLQRQNTQLGIEDSAASAGERVELLAGDAGMAIAAPTALHFLGGGASDLRRAVAVLTGSVQAPAGSLQESAASTSGGSQGSVGSAGLLASTSAPASEPGGSAGAVNSTSLPTGAAGSGSSESPAETSSGASAPTTSPGAPASRASIPGSSAGAGASVGGAAPAPASGAGATSAGEGGSGGGTKAGPQG